MSKSYVAVTYDVCEHNDLYEDMNEYNLDSSVDMGKQVKRFAEQDIASLSQSLRDGFKCIGD